MRFDIVQQCFDQVKRVQPLIAEEHTLLFEKSTKNSSNQKYVVNAKYWLIEILGEYAKTKLNHSIVVEAYKHIVSTILKSTKKRPFFAVMDYVKFDVINEIFKSDFKGQLGLIKSIYMGLNELLSENPHFYHQHAKCNLWQSDYKETSLKELHEALKYASLARYNFSIECEHNPNEKLSISLAHTDFTIALITSKISAIYKFENETENGKAIEAIYQAIQSPYNIDDFVQVKYTRKGRADDISGVLGQVMNMSSESNRNIRQKYAKELSNINTNLLRYRSV